MLIRRILVFAGAGAAALVLALVLFVAIAIQGVPSEAQLADYEPPITTRVYAGDGKLIAEFAREQRVFVPIETIPDNVKNAFLSAEDKSFYEHGGIDFTGLMRATAVNILSIFTGDRMQGASTITQQVAKNMLLTSDRTITRKVKEAFLAQRIERAFDKDRILELYLNEIYLGQRAYGVAAAALNYFDKPLEELSLAQAAYLAALPKGPNNYHPIRRKEQATERRNWVLSQMARNGYITEAEAAAAQEEELLTTDRLSGDAYVMSAHFVEELRREVVSGYGEKELYDEGLSIRSTLDTAMQVAAARALRKGLDAYDRRHSWRGPIDTLNADGDVQAQLAELEPPPGASGWLRAMVTEASARRVSFVTETGAEGQLSSGDIRWATTRNKDRQLKRGAAIYVQPAEKNASFTLRQVPEVEGAIVAMDANTGRVMAMVGGYSFGRSEYNRVTQARRQPGSSFKPIVYAAALDFGLTPATRVLDEPFSMEAGDGTTWNPENYTKEFYGPTTLRTGLEKSRNLMTIRLAYEMGMEQVADYAQRLGSHDKLEPLLANSLGSGETTLMRMVTAYAAFVNGGKQVRPILFDRIQNRYGETVYPPAEARPACVECDAPWRGQAPPSLPDRRVQTLDPITAYQITSMLESAVSARGTGASARVEGLALAGKTGTTNDYKDAWFIGFSPDLVVGVWIGFDKPKSMGEGETGGRIAAPIFRDFMSAVLKPDDAPLFRRPPGVRIVRIDGDTGLLPGVTTTRVIDEYFRPDTEPTTDYAEAPVIGQSAMLDPDALGDLGGLFLDEGVGAAPGVAPGGGAAPIAPSAPDGTPTERPAPAPPPRTAGQPEQLQGVF